MSSAEHRRLDDAVAGVVKDGGLLEGLVVLEMDRGLVQSRRLFRVILAIWSSVVVVAAAGLWSWERQRKRAGDVLRESRELQQTKESHEEGTRRLTLLHEAGLAMAAETSVEKLMQTIVDRTTEPAGARYGGFGMYGTDGEMELFRICGVDEEVRRKIGRPPSMNGQMGWVAREKLPLRLADLGQHPRAKDFPPNHPPMKSFLGVPVLSRGAAAGVLYLTEKQGAEEFSQEDQDLLVLLASQASLSIDNARSYAEVEKRKNHLATINHLSAALNSTLEMDQVLELFFREVQG